MMKKYFFTLIFMFSFFFFGLTSNVVSAAEGPMQYTIDLADSYDNRIIDITITNYNGYARSFLISELAVCSVEEEDSCQKYARAKNNDIDYSDIFMKVVGEETRINIPQDNVDGELLQTTRYTIQTVSDGDIFILIQCLSGSGGIMSGTEQDYAFGVYKLSTLNQRIVINADAEGKPTYSYDNIQYTPTRNNKINIGLFTDEYVTYNGEVYVCEYYQEANHKCLKYTISEDAINYYFESYGDGEKTVNFYLVKRDQTITDNNFTDTNSTLISKKIILDTVGPKITIEGGQWIFVPVGSKYKAQNATCRDSTFTTEECIVDNDLDIVRINYKEDNYQLVTYSATDKLGNTSSVVVKVKVEIPTDNTGSMIAILVSVGVILVTFSILGVILYSNHQKKKKLSYI